ncbi:MAG: Rpn family recombination-promoting nuclease/putative transposase [Pseudomonadota bacterium]|nr:Rpn family recombination-promoting nuclease/putative transposase [Pseudomonadota bacterium]
MPSDQVHPHDAVFKRFFKDCDYCCDLLQILLAPSLCSIFDWQAAQIGESVVSVAKGREVRADIVLEVPFKHEDFHVVITIVLEHKSYAYNDTILQMLSYYNAVAQKSNSLVLPIIVTCFEDKQATIPSDYISWVLRKQGASEELIHRFRKLPNFNCILVNLHDLSYRRMRRGGEEVSLALFGMRNYWERDDEVVAKIIKKARLLPHERRSFVLGVLMDYYEHADKRYGKEGFARVERKYFPNLKEEERLMPEFEFTYDKLARLEKAEKAAKQAIIKGRQEGIKQGIEQCI